MKRFTRCAGFTLVELLVVIAIIGILAGLLFPLVTRAQKSAKKAKASTEVRAIATAIEAYYNEYGKLPIPDAVQGESEPLYFTADEGLSPDASKAVIRILTANDSTNNPREMVFLDAQKNSTDGSFVDPWGKQYEMKFDADYSGKLEFYSGGSAANSENITKSVVVVSFGPDADAVMAALKNDNSIRLPNKKYKDVIASHF